MTLLVNFLGTSGGIKGNWNGELFKKVQKGVAMGRDLRGCDANLKKATQGEGKHLR